MSCRDAPDVFEPDALEPLGPAPYRLTFDPDPDTDPSWSPGGDTIYYLAGVPLAIPSIEEAGAADTVQVIRHLKKIPLEGGVATRMAPVHQPDDGARLSFDGYSVSSTGERLATASFLPPHGPACDRLHHFVACDPFMPTLAPALQGAVFADLPASPTGRSAADGGHRVDFDGRRFDVQPSVHGPATRRYSLHPFQVLYLTDLRSPVRVSWDPGDTRFVTSDGLRLLIFEGGNPAAIENTEDGARPRWSPDGRWIAFERYERGPEQKTLCLYREPDAFGEVACVIEFTTWEITARDVALIRPDGSGLRILGPGADPAWLPNSRRLVYAAPDGIRTVSIDGEDGLLVPGTGAGREPAVSPDGSLVAFSRPTGAGDFDYDIWIAPLAP